MVGKIRRDAKVRRSLISVLRVRSRMPLWKFVPNVKDLIDGRIRLPNHNSCPSQLLHVEYGVG